MAVPAYDTPSPLCNQRAAINPSPCDTTDCVSHITGSCQTAHHPTRKTTPRKDDMTLPLHKRAAIAAVAVLAVTTVTTGAMAGTAQAASGGTRWTENLSQVHA